MISAGPSAAWTIGKDGKIRKRDDSNSAWSNVPLTLSGSGTPADAQPRQIAVGAENSVFIISGSSSWVSSIKKLTFDEKWADTISPSCSEA